VIARYTRPEIAELWSDHARFEAMRRVEVAACEEMEGPSADELEAYSDMHEAARQRRLEIGDVKEVTA